MISPCFGPVKKGRGGGVGPGPENTAGGRDGPIERWSRTTGSQRGGGRSGCTTKHCWGFGRAGLVSPSKSCPEKPNSVYYYSAV